MNIIQELYRIQQELKKSFPYFPIKCCSTASAEMYRQLGIEPKSGIIEGALPNICLHNWGLTNNDYIADITLHQFSKYFANKIPEIIFLPKSKAEEIYGYCEFELQTKALQKSIIPPKKTLSLKEYFYL